MPAPNRYPGLGARIAERMRALGYWDKEKEQPKVMPFLAERLHGLWPQYLYTWLKDETMPTQPYVLKLAKALEVPAAWLLFGDEGIEEAAVWWAEHRKERKATKRGHR